MCVFFLFHFFFYKISFFAYLRWKSRKDRSVCQGKDTFFAGRPSLKKANSLQLSQCWGNGLIIYLGDSASIWMFHHHADKLCHVFPIINFAKRTLSPILELIPFILTQGMLPRWSRGSMKAASNTPCLLLN